MANQQDEVMRKIVTLNNSNSGKLDKVKLNEMEGLVAEWYELEAWSASETGADMDYEYDPDIKFEDHAEVIGEKLLDEEQSDFPF